MFVFWFKLHWSLFQRSIYQQINIGLVYSLAPNRWETITWTNVDQEGQHHMPSLGHSELKQKAH